MLFRSARAGRDHQAQGTAVVADIVGTDIRLHGAPRFHLVVEQDAPRLRRVRLVLATQAFEVLATPAVDRDVVEEGAFASVDAHPIEQPLLVANEPRQDRREVGPAPARVAHPVDGEVVDGGTANNISYEVGSDKMLPGLDEALQEMSAGETKTFQTELFGGEPGSGGQVGDVEVTLNAVKKRELPPLDDSFAALASEFETLEELRNDFKTRLERVKTLEQGAQARDLLVEELLAKVEIPIPESYVLAETEEHLKGEGRESDDAHRAEVDSDLRKSLTNNFLLDAIVDQEKVEVSEEELSEFIVRTSMRYGMSPDQFANEVAKAGQLSSLVADVARSKALAVVLGRAKIVDKNGKAVDIEALRPQLKK